MANWTDEELDLMVSKLAARLVPKKSGDEKVSDATLFNAMGVKVKHGD